MCRAPEKDVRDGPRLLSGVMDGGEMGHRKGQGFLAERQVMS